MRARKKLEGVELKMLSLKVRKDVWLAWKMRAAIEETTMSELVERLVLDYVAREGGVDVTPHAGTGRRAATPKKAGGAGAGPSTGKSRR
jgi:hypothetical protein